MSYLSILPEINLVIMTITTIFYTFGCIIYGNRNYSKKLHPILSFSGWIGTLLFFLVYMLQRSIIGSLSAPSYLNALYYPTLIIHMITATITLILPVILLIIGLMRRKGKVHMSLRKLGN
ncbi:MAG: DUF420 domain-containing protein, partial [Promethearchaeota archaeon]